MVQIQFSLIKRNKDWMFRTPDNPPPPTSDNISFLPYPPPPHPPPPHPLPSPPPQSGRYTCIAPKETDRVFAIFSHISSISKIFQISHLKKYHYNSTFSLFKNSNLFDLTENAKRYSIHGYKNKL